ncbi:MAG TPA: hypothetical protein VLK32_02285 [Bacillota bacterium]|nr:hypothetical protein [Bacillota bacterium]
MTSVLAPRRPKFEEFYASHESAEAAGRVRHLLDVDRALTAVMEAEFPWWSDEVAYRFKSLAAVWRRECAHLSSIRDMVLHPAYQQIIGMGKDALPLLIRELDRNPDHWFWALRAITGEDPVRPEHRGDVRLMAQDWVDWARKRGLTL